LKQTFFWGYLGQLGRPLFVMLICNLVLRIFLLFSLLGSFSTTCLLKPNFNFHVGLREQVLHRVGIVSYFFKHTEPL
jgi:hypothetical protein